MLCRQVQMTYMLSKHIDGKEVLLPRPLMNVCWKIDIENKIVKVHIMKGLLD